MNWLRKRSFLCIGMAVLLMFSGCGTKNVLENTVSEGKEATTVTSRSGEIDGFPQEVNEIISLAPAITETLIHLGLGDSLVGVDQYSATLTGVPEGVLVLDMMAPDVESIVAQKPDVIFATDISKAAGSDPFETITDLGVWVGYIPSASGIAEIQEDIRFIGKMAGVEEKAETIVSDMNQEIQEIMAKIPLEMNEQRVYFEIAEMPHLYSFGSGIFLDELITILGAKNILGDQDGWVSVSEEVVLERNPSVIFTNIDYLDDPVATILNRRGWGTVSAVQDKTVYLVDKNASSRPNEFITVVLRQMAEALYPEIF